MLVDQSREARNKIPWAEPRPGDRGAHGPGPGWSGRSWYNGGPSGPWKSSKGARPAQPFPVGPAKGGHGKDGGKDHIGKDHVGKDHVGKDVGILRKDVGKDAGKGRAAEGKGFWQ